MEAANQISRRHHFIPQFYLKHWYDQQIGKLWLYFRNPVGQVEHQLRSAKSVGYEYDLYTLTKESIWPPLNPAPDFVETFFSSTVDSPAAIAHKKMIVGGLSTLSEMDRQSWALFLSSLMQRSPKKLLGINWDSSIEEIKQQFAMRWGNSDLLGQIDFHGMYHNSIKTAMTRYICNKIFLNYVAGLKWMLIDIQKTGEHFLTNDAPLMINGGIDSNPIHLMTIALTPEKLLIIHDNSPEFDNDFFQKLALIYNHEVVKNTQKHLISSRKLIDSSCIKYVKLVDMFLTPKQ